MRTPFLIVVSVVLSSCGGGGGGTAPPAPPPVATFTVGGSISGLEASGLALANGNDLVRPGPGATSFSFPQRLAAGAAYSVSVATQPLGFQLCNLIGPANGAIANADVSAIGLKCGDAAASVSTLLSGEASTSTRFSNPYHLVVDGSGTIFVADNGNSSIIKISGGVATVFAGGVSGDADGIGTSARFGSPTGITVDNAGNLYVTDGQYRRIRKISPDGKVTTVAGSGHYGNLDGDAYTASFSYPSGIAVDKAGNLYVADNDNNTIRKVTPAGDVSTFAGSGRMGEIDGQGTAASFSYPVGICIDAAGNLLVADSAGDRVRRITPGGMVSTLAGSGIFGGKDDGPAATAKFDQPIGIAVDNAGFVYVSELTNKLVRRISPSGQVRTLAGGGQLDFGDGIGAAASFAAPKGIAVDNRGNLFVADANRIRRVAPVAPVP